MAEKEEEAKEQMEQRETTATQPHVSHKVAGDRTEAPKVRNGSPAVGLVKVKLG